MKNKVHMQTQKKPILLILGIFLFLASLVAYGYRVYWNILPTGASPEEIKLLTEKYGLDNPLAVQYSLFLVLYIIGLILLGAYGTLGRKPDVEHGTITKFFLVLMMVANALLGLLYMLLAPRMTVVGSGEWWLTMGLPVLGLCNFFFAIAIWNGRRWAVWGFLVATLFIFVLNLLGGLPLLSSLFGVSTAFILLWLIWPNLWKMD